MEIVELLETTSGRADSLKGAIGTIKKASTFGSSIGPPALNAYDVEPVGVAIPWTRIF